jgi:hypothetical protein
LGKRLSTLVVACCSRWACTGGQHRCFDVPHDLQQLPGVARLRLIEQVDLFATRSSCAPRRLPRSVGLFPGQVLREQCMPSNACSLEEVWPVPLERRAPANATCRRPRSPRPNFAICGRAGLTFSSLRGAGPKFSLGLGPLSARASTGSRGAAGRSEDCEVEEGLVAGMGRSRAKNRVRVSLRGCIHGSEHSSDLVSLARSDLTDRPLRRRAHLGRASECRSRWVVIGRRRWCCRPVLQSRSEREASSGRAHLFLASDDAVEEKSRQESLRA